MIYNDTRELHVYYKTEFVDQSEREALSLVNFKNRMKINQS